MRQRRAIPRRPLPYTRLCYAVLPDVSSPRLVAVAPRPAMAMALAKHVLERDYPGFTKEYFHTCHALTCWKFEACVQHWGDAFVAVWQKFAENIDATTTWLGEHPNGILYKQGAAHAGQTFALWQAQRLDTTPSLWYIDGVQDTVAIQ